MDSGFRTLDCVLDSAVPGESPAIVHAGRSVSYGRLRAMAGGMAERLARSGIRKGDRIAICMEKSPEYVAALIGTLKAGGVCVPIDPDLPVDRIRWILESAGPSLFIGENGDMAGGAAFLSARTLSETGDAGPAQGARLPDAPMPGDLAYLIHTSGSTGKPKGVMLRHDGICALVSTALAEAGYSSATRYLSVCPFHFDASLTDIFCTFAAGGSLYLDGKFALPREVLASVERHRITDTLLPSTLVKLLAGRFAGLDRYDLGSLRTLWYGGESCPVSALETLKAKVPHLKFIHGYGPTEATHTATWFLCDTLPATGAQFLPIGKALPTVEAFALDGEGRPIAPGGSGELLLSGIQIMEGYWNDPGLTSAALVPHPFRAGQKAYRTGDYVTIDEAGDFHFLERRDEQVKSGGHLVHLSEIAARLREHPAVQDAVVAAAADELLGKRILAFIFGAGSAGVDIREMRGFLGMKLPSYMIPHEFHFRALEDMPRNSNGKLDRQKLVDEVLAGRGGTHSLKG